MAVSKCALPFVEIGWVDAASQIGWKGKEDIEEHKPVMCVGVGFIVEQDKERTVLTAHIAADSGAPYADPIVIPTANIKYVYKLSRNGKLKLKK